MSMMNRKNFISTTTASLAGLCVLPGQALYSDRPSNPVCIFSKCLQFLNYDELGETISKIGFNGADLTVRKGGYVLPENVKIDLPGVVKALRKAGIDVPMIVTDINDANDRYTEDILATAAELGIKYYRMGSFYYHKDNTVFKDLDGYKKKLEGLEKLNRKYDIRCGYQNHSGPWGIVGGAVWDLYYILKDFDPEYVGIQYDIAHATAEGGYSWELALKVVKPWINSLAIKDFVWQKGKKRWETKWVPLGDGMVDFKRYSEQVNPLLSEIPITIHYEYDLGGAELGKQNPLMLHDEIYLKLAKDLHYFKNNIKAA